MPIVAESTIRRIITTVSLATIALFLVVLATACTTSERDSVVWPTGEWRTATPEEQDMDSARLQQMMDLIDGHGFSLD